MTISVTHTKVSAIADDPTAAAAGEVLPSDWNAGHTITGLATVASTGAYADLTGTPSNANTSTTGLLTSTDWNTFNGKQTALVSGTSLKTVNSTSLLGAGDVSVGVTTVSGTAPVVSSGGNTPAISMAAATTSVNGYLTSTDWNTFNGKQTALVSATNIKTVGGNTLLGSGDLPVVTAIVAGTNVTISPVGGTGAVTINATGGGGGGGGVSSVTGTAPIVSSGGATPAISLPVATTSVDGYLAASDWTTFNNKSNTTGTVTSVAATVPSFLSVSGTPITNSGTLTVSYSGTALPVLNGGTGVTTSTGAGAAVLGTRPTLAVTGAGLTVQDATDNTKQANFDLSGLTTATNYTYALPATSGSTLTTLAGAQIWTGSQNFNGGVGISGGLSYNGLAAGITATALTTGVVTIGGTGTTSIFTFGQATGSQTTNIQAGATASASTKTINIGTGGLTGSTTTMAIGSTFGTSITANGTWTFSTPLAATNLDLSAPPAIGGTTPSTGAFTGVTLSAGTTSVAPIKLTNGTNLTTATAGALEYDGSSFYLSPAASTRGVLRTEQMVVLNTAYTLTSQTAAQKLFNASTNGAVTLPIGTYQFECFYALSALSATSGSFGYAMVAGTAVIGSQGWWSVAQKGATAVATATATQSTYNTAANTTLATASTNAVGYAFIRGIIKITTAGTVIPSVSLGVAAAAVVGVNSYFKVSPVTGASAANIAVGNWS